MTIINIKDNILHINNFAVIIDMMENAKPVLTMYTPAEMGLVLSSRVRSLRLNKGWTRETMAERAGVTAASLKRFENTGLASLGHLLRLAHALARLDEFEQLLRPPPAQSLSELEQNVTRVVRKRGRR